MKRLLSIFSVVIALVLGSNAQVAIQSGKIQSGGLGQVVSSGGGCTPSYANTGGTGNRSSIITVVDSSTVTGTSIVSGSGGSPSWVNNAALATGQSFFNSVTGDGVQHWIRFDFGSGHSAQIVESKFYQGDATSQGTWKWQGSNVASPNTTTDWTDIGGNFTLVTAATTTSTSMSANTTYYRYYRMLFMSGTTSSGPWTFQMEFKLCYQ